MHYGHVAGNRATDDVLSPDNVLPTNIDLIGNANGAAVIAISPMTANWAVRFLSHHIYPDLESFETDLKSGRLAGRIAAILARRERPV